MDFSGFNVDVVIEVILKVLKTIIKFTILKPVEFITSLPEWVKIVAFIIIFAITCYVAYWLRKNKETWRFYMRY